MKKNTSVLFFLIFFAFNGISQQLTSPMDFLINSPGNVSGELDYTGPVDFGPTTLSTVTGDLEWAYTSGGDSLACTTVVTNLAGKIALIRRGSCTFTAKVYEAQLQGAVGCVILNTSNTPVLMAGGPNAGLVTIPTVLISYDDGEMLIAEMELGNTVNASFFVPTVRNASISWAYKTPIHQIIPHEFMGMSVYNSTGVSQTNIAATLEITDPLGGGYKF
jgi:hypothetical protein